MATLWNYLFRPEQGEEREMVRKFPRNPLRNSCFGLEEEYDWVVVKDEECEKEEGLLQFIPTVPKIQVESFSLPMTRPDLVEPSLVSYARAPKLERIPFVAEVSIVNTELEVAGEQEEVAPFNDELFEPVLEEEAEVVVEEMKPMVEVVEPEEVKQDVKEIQESISAAEIPMAIAPATNTHVAHLLMERDSMTNSSPQSARSIGDSKKKSKNKNKKKKTTVDSNNSFDECKYVL